MFMLGVGGAVSMLGMDCYAVFMLRGWGVYCVYARVLEYNPVSMVWGWECCGVCMAQGVFLSCVYGKGGTAMLIQYIGN